MHSFLGVYTTRFNRRHKEFGHLFSGRHKAFIRDPTARLERSGTAHAQEGASRKLRVAGRLRRETTMTLAWIAEKLCMGTPTHLASLLYRQERKESNDGNSENTLF